MFDRCDILGSFVQHGMNPAAPNGSRDSRMVPRPGIVRSVLRAIIVAGATLGALAVFAALIVRGPVILRTPHRPITVEVSPERLRSTVETLSVRFPTRWITHPQTLRNTADKLDYQRMAEVARALHGVLRDRC